MKTSDMEIALMKKLDIRRNLIVPNIHWSMLAYEADLVVLTKSNYATEIEIKVSKADLKKDKEKRHFHDSIYFKYFYYAVPHSLQDFALTEIPDEAGLYVVRESGRTNCVRKAKERSDYKKWTDEERTKLAELGCMRIQGLKQKIAKAEERIKRKNEIIKQQEDMISVADELIKKMEKHFEGCSL